MKILTKEKRLVEVNLETQSAEEIEKNITFCKITKKFKAIAKEEYLEIVERRITRVHLYRKVEDVVTIDGIVYLVGDKWIESIEEGELTKEKEFKEKIVDVVEIDKMLGLLHKDSLQILDKNLKRIDKTKLEIRYPEKIFILEEDKTIGILSVTEKSVYIFSSSGRLIKKTTIPNVSESFTMFFYEENSYLAVSYKNKIIVQGITKEFTREIETEHISSIFSLEFSSLENLLYSASKEGTVCKAQIEEGAGEVVYVEASGIEKVFFDK